MLPRGRCLEQTTKKQPAVRWRVSLRDPTPTNYGYSKFPSTDAHWSPKRDQISVDEERGSKEGFTLKMEGRLSPYKAITVYN